MEPSNQVSSYQTGISNLRTGIFLICHPSLVRKRATHPGGFRLKAKLPVVFHESHMFIFMLHTSFTRGSVNVTGPHFALENKHFISTTILVFFKHSRFFCFLRNSPKGQISRISSKVQRATPEGKLQLLKEKYNCRRKNTTPQWTTGNDHHRVLLIIIYQSNQPSGI